MERKKARVRKMIAVLKDLFPSARTVLRYRTPWELLVAVVLSAQCTDRRVNEVTKTLFKNYKSVRAFARVSQKELERAIYSTGFYKMKAKHLREAAKIICNRFNGKVPRTMDELLTLPGVARKTANIILGVAFGTIEGVAVDTHVRRFALKFDLTDHTDPKRIERDLMELVPRKEWLDFNHRLVEYGRRCCPARRHDCKNHPLTKVYPRATRIWPKAK